MTKQAYRYSDWYQTDIESFSRIVTNKQTGACNKQINDDLNDTCMAAHIVNDNRTLRYRDSYGLGLADAETLKGFIIRFNDGFMKILHMDL